VWEKKDKKERQMGNNVESGREGVSRGNLEEQLEKKNSLLTDRGVKKPFWTKIKARHLS